MPAPDPPRPLPDRPLPGAADVDSLVTLGRATPPPRPAPRTEPPTPKPPPSPPVPDAADEATLNAALTAAGISVEAEDAAAVEALAGLDSATVDVVARWIKAKKGNQPAK